MSICFQKRKKITIKQIEASPMIGLGKVKDVDSLKNTLSILKISLCLFNIILLISGMASLTFGVYVYFSNYKYFQLIGTASLKILCITFVISNLFSIFILSVIGCFSVFANESYYLWNMFSISLMVVFIANLSVLCGASKLYLYVKYKMARFIFYHMINFYYVNLRITNTINSLQQKFKCCGTYSYLDWSLITNTFESNELSLENIKLQNLYNDYSKIKLNNAPVIINKSTIDLYQENKDIVNLTQFDLIHKYIDQYDNAIVNLTRISRVPDSCCISISSNCGYREHPSNIYFESCAKVYEMNIQQQLVIIAIITFLLCCVQFLGIVLSCVLVKKTKDWKEFQRIQYWK